MPCVIHRLQEVLNKSKKPLILWSDGCNDQNRNAVFTNALLHYPKKKKSNYRTKVFNERTHPNGVRLCT